MAFYTLFTNPIQISYKAKLYSQSSLFYLICTLANIILPFIIIYRSDGLWRKIETYREQADVNFKHQLIVSLDLKEETSQVYNNRFWSTFPVLNHAFHSGQIRVPFIKSTEIDADQDGKYDEINIHLSIPIKSQEQVVGMKLILFFHYKLHDRVELQMESVAYAHYESTLTGSRIRIIGELRFHQNQPLSHRGWDFRFNDSLIASNNIIENLMEEYMKRNITCNLGSNTYYDWRPKIYNSTQVFEIDATIKFPEENIFFRAGFWYLIKWAWIQYLSVYLIFYYIIKRILLLVFENQLVVDCIVDTERKQK